VCGGASEADRVCLQLPPASIVDKVDVFFLFDDTGSFQNFVPSVSDIFASLVADLEQQVPGVEFGFGVGRFEDYGGPGTGFSGEDVQGRPFILNQPIVTAADAGSAANRDSLMKDALSRTAPGFGGDDPEADLEALSQVATGLGFDGDGDGSTIGVQGLQPAGSLGAQTDQDGSGDVPAFSTLDPSIVHSGSLGGAGFRPGALHIVFHATDICSVTAFDPAVGIPVDVSGTGGTAPASSFDCGTNVDNERFGFVANAKTLESNTIDGAVAPSGAATLPATIAALNAAGIRVIGLVPVAGAGVPGGALTASAATLPAGPSSDPVVFLSALAQLTGAVDGTGAPLVFPFSTQTAGALPNLEQAIVNAISETTTLPVDVVLVTGGSVPASLSVASNPSVVHQLPPGGQACFDVTFTGASLPNGEFELNFEDAASGADLGAIPVTVGCVAPTTTTTTLPASACGDGAVGPGEECDAGAANGGVGSCCDANCRLRPAGAVCRGAPTACDQDAICDGTSAGCPPTVPKQDGDLCDDGNPETGTDSCQGHVCRGVRVTVQIPSEVQVSPGGLSKVAVPVTVDIPPGSGSGKVQLIVQGFVSCGELPPLGSECTTRRCRRLQRQLSPFCTMPLTSTFAVESTRDRGSPGNPQDFPEVRTFAQRRGAGPPRPQQARPLAPRAEHDVRAADTDAGARSSGLGAQRPLPHAAEAGLSASRSRFLLTGGEKK
jgi:hypothetical protein